MCLVVIDDPLKKREEFAVKLRKEKTQQKIKEKRQKFMTSMRDPVDNQTTYCGFPKFEDQAFYR